MKTEISTFFASLLLKWNKDNNHRNMPWKGVRDPYKIWLSEIILQQTRVEQGEKYYIAFTTNYPKIGDLARAKEETVFKMWQGLGYYNRCRNMISTAKFIDEKLHGVFPNDYQSILALKGIGEYTAAAISSFAFDLPYAVVDGNVVRVLSRVFALNLNYFAAKEKKEIQDLAQSLIDKKHPAKYNQAIMDLGATICKPQNPLCTDCPFNKICKAYLNDSISDYPIKKERKALKERHFHFLVLHSSTHFYLHKRAGNDIWKDLHTFYNIEAKKINAKLLPDFIDKKQLGKPDVLTQILSHQKIDGYFYFIPLHQEIPFHELNLMKVKKSALNKFAFPKMIVSFFEKYKYL